MIAYHTQKAFEISSAGFGCRKS